MTYRETEKVKAHKEAQAQLIIASAIDIIAKKGMAAASNRAIAERAGMSTGNIFRYFPDMAELVARVEHTIMTRDVEAMHKASMDASNAVGALVASIAILFNRMGNRESREMAGMEGYARGVAIEIEKQLRPFNDETTERRLIARATLGVVCQLASLSGSSGKRLSTAILFVLKGIGASVADQRKAMELV